MPAASARRRALILFLAIELMLALLSVRYIYGVISPGMTPIRSDGTSYQAYLPATIIYHDLSFTRYARREFGGTIPDWVGIFHFPETGGYLNKYGVGTALLQAPFFVAADWGCRWSHCRRTGTSAPYQMANLVSSIFYLCLGSLLVVLSLTPLFGIRPAIFSTALMVFGTSAFHYATFDGSFSHIYSFAAVALYLWAAMSYSRFPNVGWAAAAGASLGLIALVRAPNLFVGLLMAGAWLSLPRDQRFDRSRLYEATAFFVAAATVFLPQLLYWKYATGHLLVYPYIGEGFSFFHPEIGNFLFSVSKGLFFWSPVSLIAVLGFLSFHDKPKALWAALAACIALQVYICASWYQWWFGGGFGSRPFVDLAPLLAVGLAGALTAIRNRTGSAALNLLMIPLAAWTVVLMGAYWLNFVPFDHATWTDIAALPSKYVHYLSGQKA